MTSKTAKIEELYQDLLIQTHGKNIVGTNEAARLANQSWSTIDRAIGDGRLKANQNGKHNKRSIYLRELVRYILGYFDY